MPWITVGEISNCRGKYLIKTSSYLTAEGAKQTRIIAPGTLLLTNSGATLGVPRISTIQAGANDGVAMIVDLNGADSEYLYHFLTTKTKDLRNNIAPGNGQPNLNTDLIGNILVPLPPISEQKAISATLDLWDSAIEKTERLIAAKRMLLSRLRERLFRLHPHVKPTFLRSVTRESATRNQTRLGREFVMAVTKADGIRPMREETISTDLTRYKLVRPQAFAYNPMRLNIGSIAMSELADDVLVSPDYVVFECDTTKLLPRYLYHLRFSNLWSRFFDTAGSGSVRVRIYYDDLADFAFVPPTIEEQTRVVALLDLAQKDVEDTGKLMESYRKQKRGLMQKLLTGQWRVGTP